MKAAASLLVLLSASVVSTLAPPPARAAESFDACTAFVTSLPATLSSSGRYCLSADLATGIGSGVAIAVTANNVTLDCNGFKIGNLAAGSTSTAVGVSISKSNARVVGCHFRGFYAPVSASGAHGLLLEDNLFEGGLRYGAYVNGDGVLIRENRFVDIGGRPGEADALMLDGRGEVRGNRIDGVSSTAATAFGIQGEGDWVVVDNTVRDLVGQTPALAFAMYFYGAQTILFLTGNRVQAPGDDGWSFYCAGIAVVHGNQSIGFEQMWPGCPDDGHNVIRSAEPIS